MIAVLEELVRDESAPASARVTAIRTLYEWRRADPDEEPNPFDPLDADEVAARRPERKRR
jgi:SPX domain protein involved in polyphosphate accumulation